MNSALIQPMMSDPVLETKATNDSKDSFEFLTNQLAVLGGSQQKPETSPRDDIEVLSPAQSHESAEPTAPEVDSNKLELERLRSELDKVTEDFHAV